MPSEQGPTRRIVTLTKANLSQVAGQELLALLTEITQDGELTVAEIKRLQEWLAARQEEAAIPAVSFLLETLNSILADGRISREERVEVVLAIERALPKEHRLLAQQRRQEVESLSVDSSPPDVRIPFDTSPTSYPATEPQLRYITALGGTAPGDCTIDQASRIIETLLSSSDSATRRQRMVLRFWDRVDIAQQGRGAVSDWLDQWYAEDSDRHAAWQLWKQENHGDGRHGDPETVPLGVGFEYVARLKSPAMSKRNARGCIVVLATLAAMAAVAVALAAFP
jgi:hypothetical protein